MKVCFWSTGSSIGSSSSSTFSSRQGEPNRMQFSSVFEKFWSESLPIWMLLPPCSLRIQLLAWFCGSMMSGQRRVLKMRMPFSVDSWSAGSS